MCQKKTKHTFPSNVIKQIFLIVFFLLEMSPFLLWMLTSLSSLEAVEKRMMGKSGRKAAPIVNSLPGCIVLSLGSVVWEYLHHSWRTCTPNQVCLSWTQLSAHWRVLKALRNCDIWQPSSFIWAKEEHAVHFSLGTSTLSSLFKVIQNVLLLCAFQHSVLFWYKINHKLESETKSAKIRGYI